MLFNDITAWRTLTSGTAAVPFPIIFFWWILQKKWNGEEVVSNCWQVFWQGSCRFASCSDLICIWWPNTIWNAIENLYLTLGVLFLFFFFSPPSLPLLPSLVPYAFHIDYKQVITCSLVAAFAFAKNTYVWHFKQPFCLTVLTINL